MFSRTPVLLNPSRRARSPDIEILESTRHWARSSSLWLALSADSWFGDTPFEAGGKIRDGRMSIGLYKRQDQGADFDLRFNARYRLPNLERHAYVFIGRDDLRTVVQDTPDALRKKQLLLDRPAERAFRAPVDRGARPCDQPARNTVLVRS